MKKLIPFVILFSVFACSSPPEEKFYGTWVSKIEPEVFHVTNGRGERSKDIIVPAKKDYDTLTIENENGTILINGSIFIYNKELNTLDDTQFFGVPPIRINDQNQLILKGRKYSKTKYN